MLLELFGSRAGRIITKICFQKDVFCLTWQNVSSTFAYFSTAITESKIEQTIRTKFSLTNCSSRKSFCEVIHIDFCLRTCDFRCLNLMQSIFSWALRVHEKIFIFSGIGWAFSFVFCTCKFTCEVSFNELKQVSVVKLTVKLQKSNYATNLCSSFIQFSWYFPNQLTTNNCSFIVSKKQSWHRWAKNFVSQKKSVFPSFFLSLNEVYQDKTRLFYGWQVIVLRQPRCTHKNFTLYSTVDRCDGVLLIISYFTCFLNPFYKLIDLRRMFHVEYEVTARFIANGAL